MKYGLLLLTLLITSLASGQMTMTQKVLKPVIEYQCTSELNDSKIWKASTYFMHENNKSKLKDEVCSCIGEHALKNVPAKTLLKATIDEDTKNQVVRQAVMNSLRGCLIEKHVKP